MRSLLQSMLAFCSFGLFATACAKTDTPTPASTPTDVAIKVPGMF